MVTHMSEINKVIRPDHTYTWWVSYNSQMSCFWMLYLHRAKISKKLYVLLFTIIFHQLLRVNVFNNILLFWIFSLCMIIYRLFIRAIRYFYLFYYTTSQWAYNFNLFIDTLLSFLIILILINIVSMTPLILFNFYTSYTIFLIFHIYFIIMLLLLNNFNILSFLCFNLLIIDNLLFNRSIRLIIILLFILIHFTWKYIFNKMITT